MKNRIKNIAFGIVLALMTITFLAAFTSNFIGVFQKLTVGSMDSNKSALVYIEHYAYGHGHAAADDSIEVKAGTAQTGKLLNLTNSSGSTVMSVATDGDLAAVDGTFSGNVSVTGTLAQTGAVTYSGMVTINDNLLVDGDGVSDVQVRIDGTSGQAVDILQVRAYDGTEYLDVSSAGTVGVKVAATFETGAIGLKKYSSNPCATIGADKGPWIDSSQSPSVLCWCDSATDDMRIDGSTDCNTDW